MQQQGTTMAPPTTAQGIYDLLSADTTIAPLLGTYTVPGASPVAAIAVLMANEPLPQGTIVTGIEIVISAFGQPSPVPFLTGETQTNPTWRIYVSQWTKPAGALQLGAVADRVIALLPGCSGNGIAADPPGQGLGLLEQVVITWRNPTINVVSPED